MIYRIVRVVLCCHDQLLIHSLYLRFMMSLGLTLLIIHTFTLVCTNRSSYVFHYSSCLFHHFDSNVFVYLVATITLHVLAYDPSWIYSINLSLLGIYQHIVFHLVQLETIFPVIAHGFTGRVSNRYHLLILHQFLFRHFLTLHHGYPRSLILSRLVCLLLIISPYPRTRIPPFHFTSPYYRVSFNILRLSIYKSIHPLLILIIPSLNHNLFHRLLVLMAGSGFLFRIRIILLIYEYLSLQKF